MKARSIKSAEYAARVVFAPSEDVFAPGEAIPTSVMPKVRPRATRRPRHDSASTYDVRYIEAAPSRHTEGGWLRAFDFSWLLGRAPA